MTDSFDQVQKDIEQEVGEDSSGPLREFIHALRSESDESLRFVVRFSGDEHKVVYLRDDVAEQYTDEEFQEHVQSLMLKSLGDPVNDDALADFGDLDATVRWFEEVVVATFPYREWSGVVAVLDRRESPLVDAAVDFLD